VQPKPGETWVLLTSASHMPRAVGAFRAAGWAVLPWPVGYRSRDRVWGFETSLGTRLSVLDTAGHEWEGLLAYWLRGHSSALFPAPAAGEAAAGLGGGGLEGSGSRGSGGQKVSIAPRASESRMPQLINSSVRSVGVLS